MKALSLKNADQIEKERQKFIRSWEKKRAQGKLLFIFRHSIVLALPVVFIYPLTIFCFTGIVSTGNFMYLNSIIGLVGGTLVGFGLWHWVEEKYQKELSANPASTPGAIATRPGTRP